jgi:hypothetical protein
VNPFVEFNIRAQWRDRRETAAEGAERLARLLRELPIVHPALNRWFVERLKGTRWFERLGSSMPPTPAELEAALLRGIPRNATFSKPRPEDGFTLQAWNGKELGKSWAEFTTTIGAYDAKWRGINRFEFAFLDNTSSRDPLFLPEVVKELIKLIVGTMEPECLDVFPVEWLSSVNEKGCPAGGWMSYVRDISLCDFPIGMHAEPIGEEGMLAIVSRKIFTTKNENNCRWFAQELNESLSEVRQWMMRPVEVCPFSGPVRTDLDEVMDRSA